MTADAAWLETLEGHLNNCRVLLNEHLRGMPNDISPDTALSLGVALGHLDAGAGMVNRDINDRRRRHAMREWDRHKAERLERFLRRTQSSTEVIRSADIIPLDGA